MRAALKLCVVAAFSLFTASASAAAVYWNLFNFEDESTAPAVYVTYATRADMLADENRTGTFIPDGFGAARNVVGGGAYFVRDPVPVPEPAMGWLLLAALTAIQVVRRRGDQDRCARGTRRVRYGVPGR